MYRALGVLTIIALALSGCLSNGRDDENLFAEEPVPVVEPEEGTQLAALPPVPERRPSDMSAFIPPESAHLADKRIDDLVGLSLVEAEALLGAPSFEEVQPPARIWSYNGQDCVLSVFFYPRVGGEDFRALAYEVTSATPVAAAAPATEAAKQDGEQAALSSEDMLRCFTVLVAQNARSRENAAEAQDSPTSTTVE